MRLHLHHLVAATASIFVSYQVTNASLLEANPFPQPDTSDDPLIAGFPNFVKWFRSHGGTIDDRVVIGYEPGKKIRGMIATTSIPAGTLLIDTPESLVLSHLGGDQCKLIEETIKEMKVGTQSKWYEYFEFDDSSGSHVPSQWERSNVPGRAMKELQGLPPSGETHRHLNWYLSQCRKGNEMTDMEWKAFLMFLTRAADIGLIPMYDLMNHHNGLINTKLQRGAEGGLSVFALIDIPANTPIYNTYARSGIESTVDVFNTYGFVEDWPQLWRWNDERLVQLPMENPDLAYHRYGPSNSDAKNDPSDRLQFEPNSEHYEVLVISPTLAALSPTKQLVENLGNARQSMQTWQKLIDTHHANLRSSHVNELHHSAMTVLKKLPTTIEEDQVLIPDEKKRLENVKKVGRIDMNKADAIKAIEYRLAFKKALRLAMEVAENEEFLMDLEEL